MPTFRAFFPCVLRQMAGHPKLDSSHKVKLVIKEGKSTDRDHNSISSESGHNTSTCQLFKSHCGLVMPHSDIDLGQNWLR